MTVSTNCIHFYKQLLNLLALQSIKSRTVLIFSNCAASTIAVAPDGVCVCV
jgi:hypothetical protein